MAELNAKLGDRIIVDKVCFLVKQRHETIRIVPLSKQQFTDEAGITHEVYVDTPWSL